MFSALLLEALMNIKVGGQRQELGAPLTRRPGRPGDGSAGTREGQQGAQGRAHA